jgi:thiamine-monophosphate kinase
MKVSELGEFGLIDLLAGMVADAADTESPAQRDLILRIGDDTAAWQGDSSIQLATSDTMVQNIHFKLDFTPWEDLGWQVMTANLSDIAAMGGIPRYALVSLSMPGSTEVDNITSLYRGMIELTRKHGVVIAGGNITAAPVIIINITVLGSTGNKILKRSEAVPGDKIAVTGYLGAAAAGLKVLSGDIKPDSTAQETLKQAFLRPHPRIKEGQILVEKGVKAAIDISDGLIADLGHICKSSKVGAQIETPLVPVHPAIISGFDREPLVLALSGGEDYELLFTAPENVIKSVREAVSCPVTIIGDITREKSGKITVIDENGDEISPVSSGWTHF